MARQGGYGVTVKINTGSLTAIANVIDAEFPRQKKTLAEATAHDSPSGYREFLATGLRELEPFTMVLAWDDTEATHAQILTSFAADTAVAMSIEDPLGQEVIGFDAHIEILGRITKQEEVYTAEIQVQPTGAPTIT